jgi:glyoxylase-like metal-dependent hydrolase (beta-lactamase superfamily II)
VSAAEKQFSYEPERLEDDLFVIPLPLYDGSPVNTYVSINEDGLWLIDGGLGADFCQATLRAGLQSLGYGTGAVQGLLITHGHTDHVGAADAVLANGGALLAHRREASEGRDLNFDKEWLHRNGLPRDAGPDRWRDFTWPEPTRLLDDAECLRWGSLELQVLWCPGHTPGLVCLYEPRRRLMFTTDHVMRRAPAPVSLRQTSDDDPLQNYLASVRKLKAFAVDTVLPGHGRPFHGLHQRLVNIEAEIHEQLAQIVHRLHSGPSTAYDLLELRALQDRRPIARRYAVSLVLARLRYLERQGKLERIDSDDTILYQLRGS